MPPKTRILKQFLLLAEVSLGTYYEVARSSGLGEINIITPNDVSYFSYYRPFSFFPATYDERKKKREKPTYGTNASKVLFCFCFIILWFFLAISFLIIPFCPTVYSLYTFSTALPYFCFALHLILYSPASSNCVLNTRESLGGQRHYHPHHRDPRENHLAVGSIRVQKRKQETEKTNTRTRYACKGPPSTLAWPTLMYLFCIFLELCISGTIYFVSPYTRLQSRQSAFGIYELLHTQKIQLSSQYFRNG